MCKILCVTNSSDCDFDFISHIDTLARSDIYAIILREKDLSEDEYCELAVKVIEVCNKHNKLCILHNYIDTAVKLNHKTIHLPMPVLEKSADKLKYFDVIGASVHSVDQAVMAEKLGATYITYGHIFSTDCKKGLPSKGADSIKKILNAVDIPVYPLGGINVNNYKQVIAQGVDRFAVMSGLMKNGFEEYLRIAVNK